MAAAGSLTFVSACATLPSSGGRLAVQGWMTTADGSRKLADMRDIRAETIPGPGVVITVDSATKYQTMRGFGAALTDASAWLMTHRMSPSARSALLQELFGRSGGTNPGLGLDAVRMTIGASDFSLTHYSLADFPGRAQADIAPLRAEVLPVLDEIRRINPGLTLMATPWSAPAWMKQSGLLIQGRLAPSHYGDFAEYLTSFAVAMRSEGQPIDYLTIQNEPHFEPKDYPGMRMDPAERASFVGAHLGPVLARKAPGTRILEWDHNWDQPESPTAVLSDPRAEPFIAGVAWHCYGGDVAAQSLVHDRFPAKETWFTECASGNWSPDWAKSFAWTVKTLVIGTTRNWASGVLMWNVALDKKHGPHLGGCGDCRGLVTIDSATGSVMRSPEYYAFAHASRFLRPGDVRIGSSSAGSETNHVAFQSGDGRKRTLIVQNAAASQRRYSVIDGRSAFSFAMPAGSVATLVWPASR